MQRPGGRYETSFFSSENKRFKSMAEVARFLNLEDRPTNSGGSFKSKGKNGAKRSSKESEKKRLKRELDKLQKNQAKTAKLLEDHKNESPMSQIAITDESLWNDGSNAANAHNEGKILPHSDIEAFPGIPTHCVPDMLMVWDFLCTFCRTLSLEPIELDDFASALSFQPESREENSQSTDEMGQSSSSSSVPVYLSESHIALLRLLLQDPTSDTWWWSTLETPEMIEEEGDEYLNAVDKKRKTAAAVVKIDMEGLFNMEEDPEVTTKWLQALEDVRTKKPDNSGPIKSAVKSAITITTNPLVKSYLKKAMRKWKARSAGLVKRAVVWLVDRVREARPDLWGRAVDLEEIAEQKKIVAAEAALEMDRIVEDVDDDNAEMDLEGDSDEESDSDDDEGSDNEDEYADQAEAPGSTTKQVSVTIKQNDDITPVSTFVPAKPVPSTVDLLLPPSKPSVPSDLVHALTWPPVIGAATCRVLHWYRRRRNEVDDSIREFRQLRPMSVADRRKRELSASLRILSECADQPDNEANQVESAINHLCDGNDYLALNAVQRLCIFRILIEAAYDTLHVQQNIEDNFKARMNATKALDAEERRAKKEAREEQAALESSARERLAREAQDVFFEKKRQEIFEYNEEAQEYTDADIENMEDEEIIEFDEENKAEYEALPKPESFNKAEVNAVVAKIIEETSFGTEVLTVLTLEELGKRDEQYLKSLEDELEALGDASEHRNQREYISRKDRLRRDITSFTDELLTLPQDRSAAIDALKDAMEDGTVKTLRAAIKTAKLARLSGDDEETGGVWALDLLRDAAVELRTAESRKRVTEAQKDLIAKRNKCFIRTDPLGSDRYHSTFIHFDYDKSSRVWVERDVILGKEASDPSAVLKTTSQAAAIGARDRSEDFVAEDDRKHPNGESFLSFARQEYHHTAELSTLSMHHWSCYTTDRSLRILVKNLSGKCPNENALKESLKGTLEAMALASAGDKAATTVEDSEKLVAEFRTSGDDTVFYKEKQHAFAIDAPFLVNVSSAVGRRVRLRRIPDPERNPDFAHYTMGTITGWKMADASKDDSSNANDPMDTDSQPNETATSISKELDSPSNVKSPIWRLALDDGGELHISANEVVVGIARAIKWSSKHPGYVENDAPFLSYRNGMGRYCGRAAEAPSSLTPLAFAKQLLKREQDIYMPLKNRTFENNWGGKSGARNAWVASLKEYGHTFEAVRDGLLTLENAFFDLTGGFGAIEPKQKDPLAVLSNGNCEVKPDEDQSAPLTNGEVKLEVTESTVAVPKKDDKLSGKALLYDDTSRFDIELESLGNDVHGLWNSSDSREIFREIMTVSKTVSMLALGLDLVCRNSQAYINRTKSSVVQSSAKTASLSDQSSADAGVGGRRRAAMSRPGAYTDFF